jgi:hypothetical protein
VQAWVWLTLGSRSWRAAAGNKGFGSPGPGFAAGPMFFSFLRFASKLQKENAESMKQLHALKLQACSKILSSSEEYRPN